MLIVEDLWPKKMMELQEKWNSGRDYDQKPMKRHFMIICILAAIVQSQMTWHGTELAPPPKNISDATFGIIDISSGFLLIDSDNKGSLSMNFLCCRCRHLSNNGSKSMVVIIQRMISSNLWSDSGLPKELVTRNTMKKVNFHEPGVWSW